MFIELVQSLRCVRPHEPTWLVAASSEMHERDIVRGVLGCPTCHAEYPIHDGIADFRAGGPHPHDPDVARSEAGTTPPFPRDDAILRAAALLDLSSPGGFVLLTGDWGAYAPALAHTTERVHVLALDPTVGLTSGNGISIALAAGELPLRALAARGAALDDGHATPRLLNAAVSVLRAGGRLVAPARVPVPAGIRELARDERQWVGEKLTEAAPLIQLSREAGA